MKILPLTLFTCFTFLFSCNQLKNNAPYISIAGFTQGTSYHMTYQSPVSDSLNLTDDVDALLASFDQSLSTYIDTSNISLLNRNITDSTDTYLEDVFKESKRVYDLSGGAFDITVAPLIDAWGFGPGKKLEMTQEVIDSILQYVGMDKVSIQNGRLVKKDPHVTLDLNAIAQGYAVDITAKFFEDKRIHNYMIEIGGELTTRGLSPRGDKWKIGIDKPYYGNQFVGESLQEVLVLSGKSLASSGNYRKYYEVDGKKIVHTVDPLTGYTKMSKLLSVTIIADKCITADALATACMALGLEKAKTFIQQQDDVDALFIFSDDDGIFLEWMTDGMKKMVS